MFQFSHLRRLLLVLGVVETLVRNTNYRDCVLDWLKVKAGLTGSDLVGRREDVVRWSQSINISMRC